jgi:hypothetical protein
MFPLDISLAYTAASIPIVLAKDWRPYSTSNDIDQWHGAADA